MASDNSESTLERWRKRANTVAVAMLGIAFGTAGVAGIGMVVFFVKPMAWLGITLVWVWRAFGAELTVLLIFGCLEWVLSRLVKRERFG